MVSFDETQMRNRFAPFNFSKISEYPNEMSKCGWDNSIPTLCEYEDKCEAYYDVKRIPHGMGYYG